MESKLKEFLDGYDLYKGSSKDNIETAYTIMTDKMSSEEALKAIELIMYSMMNEYGD